MSLNDGYIYVCTPRRDRSALAEQYPEIKTTSLLSVERFQQIFCGWSEAKPPCASSPQKTVDEAIAVTCKIWGYWKSREDGKFEWTAFKPEWLSVWKLTEKGFEPVELAHSVNTV